MRYDDKGISTAILAVIIAAVTITAGIAYLAMRPDGENNGDTATDFDMAIVLVGRDSASGTREAFWELVMNKEDFSPTMLDKNSNGAVHQTVVQTPGAVGYVGLGYLDNQVKGVKILHNGELVEPSIANVQSGKYPIARNLNLITNGNPAGIAADFLKFTMSPEGQELVEEEGFVPMPTTPYTKPSGLSGTITITGSTTVLPVVALVAETYMDLHPNVEVMVNGGGSGVGVQAAIDGTANIGMSSRELRQSEIDGNPNLKVHIIAKDGLAVIVHTTNPIANRGLTVTQVRHLYQAAYSNWNELLVSQTSFDTAIVLVGRDSASGTREAFWELVMNKEDFSPTMLDKNSNGAVHQTVVQTPGAVGYVGLGYLDNQVKGVKIQHNGELVEPSIANVQSGKYPIARNLNLITNGAPTGIAADFLKFMMSPEGQALVEEEGFVPMPSTTYTKPSGLSGTITITGSTTVLPVVALVAEAYMDLHPDVEVMVNGGGSGVGVQAAIDGTADIGMSSRELRQSEIDANPNLKVHIVAKDGLAVIVHTTNPIADMGLTVAEVKQLYQATYSNWNDLIIG